MRPTACSSVPDCLASSMWLIRLATTMWSSSNASFPTLIASFQTISATGCSPLSTHLSLDGVPREFILD